MRYVPEMDRIGPDEADVRPVILCLFFFLAVLVMAARTWPSKHGPDLLVYGDSIVDDISDGEWPSLMSVEFDAKRGRQLLDDPTASARIIARRPRSVWIAIGTNDFGRGSRSLAEFQAAYANLLDDIGDGLPDAQIYAQAPMYRARELRNGVYLQAYRDAILAECAARPRLTCVDGRDILPLTYMPDGLHPDEKGQRRYASFIMDTAKDD